MFKAIHPPLLLVLRTASIFTVGNEYIGNFPLRNCGEAVGDSENVTEASYFIYKARKKQNNTPEM